MKAKDYVFLKINTNVPFIARMNVNSASIPHVVVLCNSIHVVKALCNDSKNIFGDKCLLNISASKV